VSLFDIGGRLLPIGISRRRPVCNLAPDVLYHPSYQYSTLVSVSTKTQDGMDLTFKGKRDGSSFSPDGKVTYDGGNFKLVTSLAQSGSLALALTGKRVVPGLNVTLSGSLPDGANSGKVAVEYASSDVVGIKAASSLSASPALDVSVGGRVDMAGRDVVLGGQAGYDAAKGVVRGWKVGFGYTHAGDYHLAGSVNDAKDVCVQMAQTVNADMTVAGEVVRNLESSETSMAVGVARKLGSGATQKVRVQHTGVVSVVHETSLDGNSKVAVSGQFDAKDLAVAPKYGLSVDFKY